VIVYVRLNLVPDLAGEGTGVDRLDAVRGDQRVRLDDGALGQIRDLARVRGLT